MMLCEVSERCRGARMRGGLHYVAGIPKGVVEGRELWTVSWVGDLRYQHRRCICYDIQHVR